MVNCPECKTEMKMKGSATKGEGMIAVFYQCPKCKKHNRTYSTNLILFKHNWQKTKKLKALEQPA